MLEAWLDVSRPECSWRPPLEIRGIVTGGGLQGQEWGQAQERHAGEARPAGREATPPSALVTALPSACSLPSAVKPGSCRSRLFSQTPLTAKTSWGAPGHSERKGKTPEVPSSWPQRAKGCLSGEADSPLAGLGTEVPAPHPAPGDRPATPSSTCPPPPCVLSMLK